MRRALGATLGLLLGCSGTAPPDANPTWLLGDEAGIATAGSETRTAFVLQAGSETTSRRFEVTIPDDGLLDVAYAVSNASVLAEAAGARFRIEVERRGESRREIFRGEVDASDVHQQRWFDLRVDLADFGGSAALTFSVEALPGDGPPPMGAWSEPVLYAAGHADPRPNVMVVSIDTLRARSVGTYGYPRDTTPFLDAWAKGGTLFENVATASVTTGPSHMSLFTGLYPENHGLRTGLDRKLDGIPTLAALFRAAGYRTAAFTEDGYIVYERGFGEGFAAYTENTGDEKRGPGTVRTTFGQARRWLRRGGRDPFFLFVHTYQVHAPFDPPPLYRELFAGDGMPGPDDPVLRMQRDRYDREIRFVDDMLRDLWKTLEDTGVARDTVVVVLSDHGEEFAEHGHYQHGGAVFEETLRVPWILRGPGVPAQRRIAAPVSLIDVAPTLLDLAGVTSPEDLDGTSLAPALRGEAPPGERTLFAEARARRRFRRPGVGELWNPPLVAVRRGDTKFIVHRPESGTPRAPERYDLARDALERSPAPVESPDLEPLRALVDDYLKGRVDAETLHPSDDPADLDPGLRERLRLLGYLE